MRETKQIIIKIGVNCMKVKPTWWDVKSLLAGMMMGSTLNILLFILLLSLLPDTSSFQGNLDETYYDEIFVLGVYGFFLLPALITLGASYWKNRKLLRAILLGIISGLITGFIAFPLLFGLSGGGLH